MLGKLLKYDMRAMARQMTPLYGALLIVAAALGFVVRTGQEGQVLQIIGVVYVALLMAISIVTITLLLQRFTHNLLGNEGYLMFTLPVSTISHISAKLLNAVIWSFFSTLAAFVSLLVMGLISMDTASLLEFMQLSIRFVFDGFIHGNVDLAEMTRLSVSFVFAITFAIISMTSRLYASFSVGHLSASHSSFASLCAFGALAIVEVFCNRILGGIYNHLDVFLASMILSMIYSLIHCFIAWIILERKLNLQ